MSRACVQCGARVTQQRKGRPRIYCSPRCKRAANSVALHGDTNLHNKPGRTPAELERLHAKALTLSRMNLTGAVLTDYRRWDDEQYARCTVLWRLAFVGTRFDRS